MKRFLKKCLLLARYSVSGFTTFVLELAAMYALLHFITLPYYFAVPIAFTLTTTAHFIICHAWVFNHSHRKLEIEYEYFFSILISGLILATLLVHVFVQWLQVDIYTARILAGVFTGLWNFYLNARFNFKERVFMHQRS